MIPRSSYLYNNISSHNYNIMVIPNWTLDIVDEKREEKWFSIFFLSISTTNCLILGFPKNLRIPVKKLNNFPYF